MSAKARCWSSGVCVHNGKEGDRLRFAFVLDGEVLFHKTANRTLRVDNHDVEPNELGIRARLDDLKWCSV
jgi:hypothetical protein